MKEFVYAALTCALCFTPDIALPDSSKNGIYFDMVHAGNRDKAYLAVALGEQSGAYLYWDLKNKISCEGVLIDADGESSNFVATSGQKYRNVGRCPETARFSLQRTDASELKALMKTDEFEREMHLTPVFMAPDKNSPPPKGADVLGVELGMEEAEITRLLVEEQGFYKSSFSPKVDFGTRGMWKFGRRGFMPSFILTDFFSIDISFKPASRAYRASLNRIPVLFFTAKPGLETEKEIAKDEHIAVVLAEGKAAYIRRQLKVDENSTDAVYDALNGKYGSFPRGTYGGLHNFLGNEDVSYGWNSVHGNFGRVAPSNWGAAVYKSDGSMMRHENVQELHGTHRIGDDCRSLNQGDSVAGSVGSIIFHSPSTCDAGTFFSIISGGWAQISVFRTGVFVEDQVNAFFDVALPVFLEKAKDDLPKSGGIGTPVVPKL